jgi:hypothetical protein
MSATNPHGIQKYWFKGLPFEGVAKTSPVDEGTQKYWFNGIPSEYIYLAIASTLTDNYDDNTTDTVKWNDWVSGSGTVAESGGVNTHTPQANSGGAGTARTSQKPYDLTGNAVFVNIEQVLNPSDVAETGLVALIDGSNRYLFRETGASPILQAFSIKADSWTQVGSDTAYNSGTMKYLQIRESGGNVYFEYSATGAAGSWTSIGNIPVASGVPVTDLYLQLETYADNLPTPGSAIFDDFNIAGTSGTNMQINIADTWKNVTGAQINIGDAWKTVTKVQVNIGDVWKNVFG